MARAPQYVSSQHTQQVALPLDLATFAETMGLVSAAASAIKRCAFSQNIYVPSRIERNVIFSAADASLATAQNRESDVSLSVNKPVETNSAETVDSPMEATAKEDVVVVLESSARKPDRTTGEAPVIKNKDVPILESPAEKNGKKRAVQEVEEEVVPPKKQREQGTAKPYTEEETERLLDAVANVKPTLYGTWEQVKQYFDKNAPSDQPSDAPTRSCKGLRSKFSTIANAMVIDALTGNSLSINLTGNPLGAETLTSKSKPVDNDAVGDTPVYNDPVGEEPAGDESFCNDARRVTMDRPLEERTSTVDANSASILSGGTNSKLPEAVEAPSDDDTMGQEAERLSDAMISFFERFSADDGMIVGKECRDAILSRLDNIERNMKSVNSKVEMILSSVRSEGALERDKQWIL